MDEDGWRTGLEHEDMGHFFPRTNYHMAGLQHGTYRIHAWISTI